MPAATVPEVEPRSFTGKNLVFALGVAAALVAAAILTAGRSGEPNTAGAGRGSDAWVPDSPQAVVLEFARDDGVTDRLLALRRTLDARPDDADAAARYAALALQHYAASGDARFLGYAEGALAHWKNDRSPPGPVWILRGRILQTQHRFSEAAAVLDRMLQEHPGSVEAMLLSADAWRRAGAIEKAKSRCSSLVLAGQPEFAQYCAADIYLALGEPEKALKIASLGQTRVGAMGSEARQWVLAVKADAAAAAGRIRTAESHYLDALAMPGAPIALHVAYADLLLSTNRLRDAMESLAGLPNADAVLMRRAIAAKELGLADFEDFRARLIQSFSDAEALGAGALHLRERAMFELYIETDADAALTLAAENWNIQKGPEDAEILIEAAEAAGLPEASRSVKEWRQRFKTDAG